MSQYKPGQLVFNKTNIQSFEMFSSFRVEIDFFKHVQEFRQTELKFWKKKKLNIYNFSARTEFYLFTEYRNCARFFFRNYPLKLEFKKSRVIRFGVFEGKKKNNAVKKARGLNIDTSLRNVKRIWRHIKSIDRYRLRYTRERRG